MMNKNNQYYKRYYGKEEEIEKEEEKRIALKINRRERKLKERGRGARGRRDR